MGIRACHPPCPWTQSGPGHAGRNAAAGARDLPRRGADDAPPAHHTVTAITQLSRSMNIQFSTRTARGLPWRWTGVYLSATVQAVAGGLVCRNVTGHSSWGCGVTGGPVWCSSGAGGPASRAAQPHRRYGFGGAGSSLAALVGGG